MNLMSPCHGISPNGLHWVYAMPEHTATATIQPWLASHLFVENSSKCHHSHLPIVDTKVNFTFTFVASPFRRVLSNAAHRLFIPGGRAGIPAQVNTTDAVQAFRHFVAHRLIVKKRHNIPHGIWVESYFLDMFPNPRFVGNVSNLEQSFRLLLTILGYSTTLFQGFGYLHCSATCTHQLPKRGYFNDTELEAQKVDAQVWDASKIEWYDAATTARVLALFERDFQSLVLVEILLTCGRHILYSFFPKTTTITHSPLLRLS